MTTCTGMSIFHKACTTFAEIKFMGTSRGGGWKSDTVWYRRNWPNSRSTLRSNWAVMLQNLTRTERWIQELCCAKQKTVCFRYISLNISTFLAKHTGDTQSVDREFGQFLQYAEVSEKSCPKKLRTWAASYTSHTRNTQIEIISPHMIANQECTIWA